MKMKCKDVLCMGPKSNSCSLLWLSWNSFYFFLLPEAKLGKDLEDNYPDD